MENHGELAAIKGGWEIPKGHGVEITLGKSIVSGGFSTKPTWIPGKIMWILRGFLQWEYPQIMFFFFMGVSFINHPAIGYPPFKDTPA